jgi:hypothetical protein
MKTPSFANHNVPQHTQDALRRFVEHGYMPGGFLTAVLCGDLFRAASSADSFNRAALFDIAAWVLNYLPMGIYGDEDTMMAHCKRVHTARAEQEAAE